MKEETEAQKLTLFIECDNSLLPNSTNAQQTHRQNDATLYTDACSITFNIQFYGNYHAPVTWEYKC
jgi:hypothetical protein